MWKGCQIQLDDRDGLLVFECSWPRSTGEGKARPLSQRETAAMQSMWLFVLGSSEFHVTSEGGTQRKYQTRQGHRWNMSISPALPLQKSVESTD